MPRRAAELRRPRGLGLGERVRRARAGALNASLALLVLALCPSTARALPRAQAQAAPRADERQAADEAFRALQAQFGAALKRLRAGELDARAPLLAAAERLAAEHDRADATEVARFYALLGRDELLAGRALEDEYEALRKELLDAGRAGLREAQWDELREELDLALDELSERALGCADFTPAARALALRARLDIERVERDGRLDEAQREALLAHAEQAAERSLSLFERVGMRVPTLEPAAVLARVDRARGRSALAREQYLGLAELAAAVRMPSWRAGALRGLVELALERGDLDEAKRVLLELAAAADPPDWYVVQRHAQTLLADDRPDEARESLLDNRPAGERALAEWRMLLGSAALRCGAVEQARALYEELPEEMGLDRSLALAALELRTGAPQQARARLEALELDAERADRRAKVLAWRGEACLACGDPAGAVEQLEAALAQAELWRQRFDSSSAKEDPVVNVQGEVLGLHATVLLARAHAALGEGLAAAAAIERTQARSLSEASRIEARELPQALSAWAAASPRGLVTWAIGADTAVVAHVAADGSARAWPIARGRRSIDGAVRLLRDAVLGERPGDAERLGREIRDELLPAELRERLAVAPGAREEALFLLHGPLEALPLELLLALDPTAGELVPRVLPGLPAPEPGAPASAEQLAGWNLLGDPWAADDQLGGALPGASRELDELAALYPDARVARGPGFDRTALLEALRGERALHVATHLVPGCSERGARLAGLALVLSGAELACPAEIAAERPALPLVVLSGCESHGGRRLDAEGLLGTARAFLESGTRNLLVTLWPVEDEAAREAALAFHRALRAGLSPASAAHEARASLRRRGLAAADWAAFRLLGRD